MPNFQLKKKALYDFIPAQLSEGKEWTIYFYVRHPETDQLSRVRYKCNRIKSATLRRRWAKKTIHEINMKLEQGWNPFVDVSINKGYRKISEAIDYFLKYQKKNLAAGTIRQETFNAYNSYCNTFSDYLQARGETSMFISKFDKAYINRFLDHIYIEVGRSAKTRDNYLAFFRLFSSFLVSADFIKSKPTEGIQVLGKKKHLDKKRNIIPPQDLLKLFEHAYIYNAHFLLACYTLYYCFIRPKEMSHLKVGDINLKNNTIFVNGKTAKNYKDAVVTIRKPLRELIIKLGVLDQDTGHYLFSDDCRPGKNRRDEKQFRDKWIYVRRKLKLPDTYQFYSLKDTGITNLLRETGDPQAVRDQARHHSLAMTDIYTPHDMMKGNPAIAEL